MTNAAKTSLIEDFEKLILRAFVCGAEYLDVDDCYEQAFDNAYKQHKQMQETLQKQAEAERKDRFKKDVIDAFELFNSYDLGFPAFTKAEVEEFLDDHVLDTIYTAVNTLREKIEQKIGHKEDPVSCDTCASSDCDNNDDAVIKNFLKQFK